MARIGGAVGLALATLSLLHASAHASTHRVALVVQHSSSWPGPHVIWRCVEFAQDAISGLALLELAGVNSGQPPEVYSWGGAAVTVCQVNAEPRQVPDRCFGPVSGPNWSDWQATAAGWAPRSSGVTGYSVRDGDLEGWTYTTGFGGRPPSVTFSQVCPAIAPPAPPATPTRQPAAAGLSAAPLPARPGATAVAVAAPTTTPSMVALAPSGSPAHRSPLAALPASPPTRPPASRSPFLLLGALVALLLGLFAWNLRRRAG